MARLSSRIALPKYVVINDPRCKNKDVLRKPADAVTFPLDQATQDIIHQLEAKFEQEENCAGLAAPQIGYNKRIIVFRLEGDEDLKKHRPDFSDTMPKSIWINPSFTPQSSKKTTDWEGCFSVHNLAGHIPRFTEISYEAWTPEGKKIQGKAKGFLARLIQHEIDHLNGKLFLDYISEDELVTRDEFGQNLG